MSSFFKFTKSIHNLRLEMGLKKGFAIFIIVKMDFVSWGEIPHIGKNFFGDFCFVTIRSMNFTRYFCGVVNVHKRFSFYQNKRMSRFR